MAFAGAHNADASHGMFNDVGQNQYNCIFQLAPLESAFATASGISSLVQQVESSREQLQVLADSIGTLLRTLDAEYCAGRLSETKTSLALENLTSLLDDIYAFAHKETATEFMKSLTKTNDRIAQIAAYYHQLDASVTSFQITSLDIQDWQRRNDEARLKDQKVLHDRLNDLDSNQNHLKQVLSAQHHSLEAMMISFQKIIDERSGGDRELKFFTNSVRLLSAMSRHRNMRRESWMITSFDIEFGRQIGFGGYARVVEGTWNRTRVAVKVLKTDEGVTPSIESFQREISTWAGLSHPHILQFLGANVLDNKPFIVTPLMDNGNAQIYIQNHPDCDRLAMLHHISLGIVYLHSQNIVHGDLKAQNVLIDDSGKALLCDFGLARLKADITTRTTETEGIAVAGSRHWMAPERLMGKSLRKPCDIYAFGITSYEIYADEVPFGHISPGELRDLVVHQHLRPERPDSDEAPQLTDEVWQLVERCWTNNPLSRPISGAICDEIRSIRESRTSIQTALPELTSEDTTPRREHTDNEHPGPRVSLDGLLDNSVASSVSSNNSQLNLNSEPSPVPLSSNFSDARPIPRNATPSNSSTSAGPSTGDSTPTHSFSESSARDARPTSQDATPSNPSTIVRPAAEDSTPTCSASNSSTRDANPASQDVIPSDTSLSTSARPSADSAPAHLSHSSSAYDVQPASQDAIFSDPRTTARRVIDESSPCSSSDPAAHDAYSASRAATPCNPSTRAADDSGRTIHSSSISAQKARLLSQDAAHFIPMTTARPTRSSSCTPVHAQPATQDDIPSHLSIGEQERLPAVTTQPTSAASVVLDLNAEPEAEWKKSLRKGIEECLLPIYDEAREFLERKLGEAPTADTATRERVVKDHTDALKNLRRTAEALYQDQIEQERQQLRWTQGAAMDREWSEGLLRQQEGILEAILEQADRAKRASSGGSSFPIPADNRSKQQHQCNPGEHPTSELDGEHFKFSWIPNHAPLSPGYTTEDRVTGRPRTSAASGHEQRYSGPGVADWLGMQYPEGQSNLRMQSASVRPKAFPEIWKPPISPEDDADFSGPST